MTGFPSKRTVVLHQDDVGMCHGANAAFLELCQLGVCSSGAVMVPCPWFLEIAEAAAADPTIDLGIHLTVNAEKRHYKWRPLTAPSPAAGLTDDNGFFWPDVATVRHEAAPEAVEDEFRAQIEATLRAGMDPTHLDGHMGAAIAPEFCDIFVRLGQEYRLPILITPTVAAYAPNDNLVGVTEEAFRPGVDGARAAGFTIFDTVVQTTWGRAADDPPEPAYKAIVEGIPPGLTYFCLHFNTPDELLFIEPDVRHIRAQEYELFRSEEFRAWLAAQDIDIIGMRPLRDSLRATIPGANA